MLNLRIPLPRFLSAGEIIHGPGCIAALRVLPACKAAVIMGGSLADNREISETIRRSVQCVDLLTLVKPWKGEPTWQGINEALREVESFNPDWLIAIGGGSIIDGVKMLWARFEHPNLDEERLYRVSGIPPLRRRARLAVLPTTIGSGSEVSSAAVIEDPVNKRKIPIVSHDFLPDIVILDPKLLCGLPRDVKLYTALDALGHLVEGYVSKMANGLTDLFAETAVRIIVENIEKGLEEEADIQILGKLQYAAMIGGWVQNHCLVGYAHALAHQFCSHIPHGQGVAMFLPAVIAFNSQDNMCAKKYSKLAYMTGLDSECTDIIQRINDLKNKGSLMLKLTSYYMDDIPDLKIIAENSLKDPTARMVPKTATTDDILRILKQSL